jgi:hypothetical protein
MGLQTNDINLNLYLETQLSLIEMPEDLPHNITSSKELGRQYILAQLLTKLPSVNFRQCNYIRKCQSNAYSVKAMQQFIRKLL